MGAIIIDLTILWLVPVAYFIHILEETPRFVTWAIKYLGAPETFGQFVREILFSWPMLS